MITTLIGVQTICIGTITYLTYKSTKKVSKMKLVKKEGNFKHFMAGGF